MLFSIGHSNHSVEHFLDLLKQHRIEVVADVRSNPYSRRFPHFSSERLGQSLKNNEIQYVALGEQLGGKPKDKELYSSDGHPDHARMAQTDGFLQGLERLKQGARTYRVAMMCSEEDPNQCHRHLLIAHSLVEQDSSYTQNIWHIRKDGSLQSEQQLMAEKQPSEPLWR